MKQHTAHLRRGYSLVELVTALAIGAVLFVAIANAIVLGAKALPSKSDPLRASVPAAQALDQMAAEIECALHVTKLTSSTIAFTVADRDGDGRPERLEYSWGGKTGDPLVRKHNGAAWPVVESVHTFSLSPSVRYVSETYPGPGVEDAVPTVLQDFTSLTNTNSQNFGNSNQTNYAQYFQPTFGSDVLAWRPTSAIFVAQSNKLPGSFRVQLRSPAASTLPGSTVLFDQSFSAAILTPVMLPYVVTFSTLDRQAVGNGVSLAFMWESGTGPGKLQTSSNFTGLSKTTNATMNWSAVNGSALCAQLFGVAVRAGPDRTASTRYLLGVGIALGAGASSGPVLQTSTLAANHPELLAGLWELRFDRDPTAVDVNGDGLKDWVLGSGGTFNTGSLSSGAWSATSDKLSTRPDSNFAGITIADVRMQSLAVGATAAFEINGAWVNNACAALKFSLALQSDGSQTLTVSQRANGSHVDTLMTYTALPAQPTDLHIVIDPAALGAAVSINGTQRGTLNFARYNRGSDPRAAAVSASGGSVKFWYARVRELEALP